MSFLCHQGCLQGSHRKFPPTGKSAFPFCLGFEEYALLVFLPLLSRVSLLPPPSKSAHLPLEQFPFSIWSSHLSLSLYPSLSLLANFLACSGLSPSLQLSLSSSSNPPSFQGSPVPPPQDEHSSSSFCAFPPNSCRRWWEEASLSKAAVLVHYKPSAHRWIDQINQIILTKVFLTSQELTVYNRSYTWYGHQHQTNSPYKVFLRNKTNDQRKMLKEFREIKEQKYFRQVTKKPFLS